MPQDYTTPTHTSASDVDFFDPRVEARLWRQVAAGPGCWIWTGRSSGRADEDGYGQPFIDGRNVLAHRLFYSRLVSPDIAGLHVHHVCEVTLCVRPSHLAAVSPVEHRAEHPSVDFSDEEFSLASRVLASASGRTAATYRQLMVLFGVTQPTVHARLVRLGLPRNRSSLSSSWRPHRHRQRGPKPLPRRAYIGLLTPRRSEFLMAYRILESSLGRRPSNTEVGRVCGVSRQAATQHLAKIWSAVKTEGASS